MLLLIFLYLFDTKDKFYWFLVILSKSVGINLLQKHFSTIDKYLPFKHNEILELHQINTVNMHESCINQVVKVNDRALITISDDCSMRLWRTASTGTIGE